jgi:hypothetical protein
MTIRHRSALLLMAATLFAASGNVAAQYTEITILDDRYSTDLSTKINGVVYESPGSTTTFSTAATQTRTSATPLDSSLVANAKTFAKAAADMFSVATETSAYPEFALNEVSNFARADAETNLSFSTLQDTSAGLQLEVIGGGSFYSDGFVSLFDRTDNQYLFSYSWESLSVPNYPPPPGSFPFTWTGVNSAFLSLETQLESSHIYDLKLHASTNANTDSQYVSLQVSGLYPIVTPAPEPETWAMMLVGLGGVGFLARRRKERTTVLTSREAVEVPSSITGRP